MEKSLVARRVFLNPLYWNKVTVLKTSDETGGHHSMAELQLAPVEGNPMHIHSVFEETFTSGKWHIRTSNYRNLTQHQVLEKY